MMPISTAKKLVLGLLGGSASFSPLAIPGLALWLDASDASTLFQASNGTTPAAADGDVVGYWGDKSGNGKNAIQATTANKPVMKTAVKNGRNAVRFTAVDDNLSVSYGSTLAQPWTYWIVVVRTAGDYILDGAGSNRHIFFTVTPPHIGINAGAGLATTGVTATNWNVYTLQFNGASSKVRANGVEVASGNAGIQSIDTLIIGTRKSFDEGFSGDIAELIASNTLATDSTNSAVESYLNAKWGVY
jgi:hypothetical protein